MDMEMFIWFILRQNLPVTMMIFAFLIKKNKKWEQFLALRRKYSPKWVFPQEAYRIEGLAPDIPTEESHLNDSGSWTEEEKIRFEEELRKKFE